MKIKYYIVLGIVNEKEFKWHKPFETYQEAEEFWEIEINKIKKGDKSCIPNVFKTFNELRIQEVTYKNLWEK